MKTALTEEKIQDVLSGFISKPKYDVDGLYIFKWESDKLLKTNSGYYYEFEIKISRADFKNDFKHKKDKHVILGSVFTHEKYLPKAYEFMERNKYSDIEEFANSTAFCEWYRVSFYKIPNYFYYAVPEDMIKEEEVPEYAGLVYITENNGIKIIKKAPLLHNTKYTDDELKLGEKFYYNMKNWKETAHINERLRREVKQELDEEVKRQGHSVSYESLENELKLSQENENKWKEEAALVRKLYLTMVENADYDKVERHMFIGEIKKYDPDFDYLTFSKEVEKKYNEFYPYRK